MALSRHTGQALNLVQQLQLQDEEEEDGPQLLEVDHNLYSTGSKFSAGTWLRKPSNLRTLVRPLKKRGLLF